MKMKKIILLVLPLSFLAFSATIEQDLVHRLHKGSTAEINAIATPEAGMLVYNSDDNKTYYYNGTNLISNLYSSILSIAHKENMMTPSGIASSVFFTNDTEADSFNEANPRLKTNKYLILSGVSLDSYSQFDWFRCCTYKKYTIFFFACKCNKAIYMLKNI